MWWATIAQLQDRFELLPSCLLRSWSLDHLILSWPPDGPGGVSGHACQRDAFDVEVFQILSMTPFFPRRIRFSFRINDHSASSTFSGGGGEDPRLPWMGQHFISLQLLGNCKVCNARMGLGVVPFLFHFRATDDLGAGGEISDGAVFQKKENGREPPPWSPQSFPSL